MKESVDLEKRTPIRRIISCLLILLLAVGGFVALKKLKKPPAQQEVQEKAINVQVKKVEMAKVPVVIKGFGELRSIRQVDIAAEISGKVVAVHDKLQVGGIIKAGEVLVAIDDQVYQADYLANKKRLAILSRDHELVTKEHQRVSNLYKKNSVGSMAGVEKAEQAMNSVANQLAQVQQATVRAKVNLDNCQIKAPFTCRVVEKFVEQDQFVSPGRKVLFLADDSRLELPILIDSLDAKKWLKFAEVSQDKQQAAWFAPLQAVAVQVSWVEDPAVVVTGHLDRVAKYNAQSRTVALVVQIEKEQAVTDHGMPLVAGMFCAVDIPGQEMNEVVELPRQAVSFENTVFIVRDNRLHTVAVEVARVQGEKAYIAKGLTTGDMVITTRLINPLEQALVTINSSGPGAAK